MTKDFEIDKYFTPIQLEDAQNKNAKKHSWHFYYIIN